MYASIIVLVKSLFYEQGGHTVPWLYRHALFDEIIPHV